MTFELKYTLVTQCNIDFGRKGKNPKFSRNVKVRCRCLQLRQNAMPTTVLILRQVLIDLPAMKTITLVT